MTTIPVGEPVEAAPARRLPWFVSFLAARMVWAAVTLFIYVTFLFFFVQWWVPYSGGGRAAAGLEQPPLLSQYWSFLGTLVSGDLISCTSVHDWRGEAFVNTCVSDSLPITLFIFAVGFVFAYLIGDYLGRLGAWRRQPLVSGTTSLLGVLSATLFPPFLVFVLVWLGFQPLYNLLQALGLDINNAPLWNHAPFGQSTVFNFLTVALVTAVALAVVVRGYARRHRQWLIAALALPVMLAAVGVGVALTGVSEYVLDTMFRYGAGVFVGSGTPMLALLGFVLVAFGQILFMMRVSIEDERAEDYVLTAWAKGLTHREIRDVHIARNAMAPTVAASFLTVPTVIAGMVIIESEMELPGLATQFFAALINQDIPSIMGILVILGVLGVALRVASDLVIAVLDPRLRVASL